MVAKILSALVVGVILTVIGFFFGYAAGYFYLSTLIAMPTLFALLKGKRSTKLFGRWSGIEFSVFYFTLIMSSSIFYFLTVTSVLYQGDLRCSYLHFTHKKYFSYKNGICTGE